jgi:hypothetical protein
MGVDVSVWSLTRTASFGAPFVVLARRLLFR